MPGIVKAQMSEFHEDMEDDGVIRDLDDPSTAFHVGRDKTPAPVKANEEDLHPGTCDKLLQIEMRELDTEIQALSQAPFRRILADLLHCRPDKASIQEFANRQPDRWAQAVTIFAKNSGYNERHIVEHNHSVLIAQLSDADLFANLREMEKKLAKIVGPVAIEHQPTASSAESITP